MPLAKDLAPSAVVEIGEPGIGVRRGMHLGEIDAARLGEDLAEHVLAADDHDLSGARSLRRGPRRGQTLLKAVSHDGVGATKPRSRVSTILRRPSRTRGRD